MARNGTTARNGKIGHVQGYRQPENSIQVEPRLLRAGPDASRPKFLLKWYQWHCAVQERDRGRAPSLLWTARSTYVFRPSQVIFGLGDTTGLESGQDEDKDPSTTSTAMASIVASVVTATSSVSQWLLSLPSFYIPNGRLWTADYQKYFLFISWKYIVVAGYDAWSSF